jgi:hypothetical protein
MAAGDIVRVKTENSILQRVLQLSLKYIERFQHARKSLIEKSIIYGLGIQRKYWRTVELDEFPGYRWEVPVRLQEVDLRRFRIERNPVRPEIAYYTVWDVETDQYVQLEDRRVNPQAYLSTQDFIWLRHEFEETSPYSRGLGEVLYRIAYIKNRTLQYWADLGEHWGKPLLVASIDAARATYDAAVNSGGLQNAEAAMDRWLEILENMRARHVAVKPEYDKLEVHEAGNTGNNLLKQLVDYCDSRINIVLLGAELTTSAPSVGSYASAQLHQGTSNIIKNYSRTNEAEEYERSLLADIYFRNRLNFRALGVRWSGARPARLEISSKREEQQQELLEKASSLDKSEAKQIESAG